MEHTWKKATGIPEARSYESHFVQGAVTKVIWSSASPVLIVPRSKLANTGEFMNSRLKHIYLLVGDLLNNPRAFGLEQRPPKALEHALTEIRCGLMKKLQEKISEEDFLSAELSQDADWPAFSELTST
jgi:hypothetical protein